MPSEGTPNYRHHKPSGQAIITLNGREIYLGPWKSKASRAEYDRLVAEWLVNGRRLPQAAGGRAGITIIELVDSYLTFAESDYRKPDGTLTSEIPSIGKAVQPLLRLYRRTQAADFGPLVLKAVRQAMIDTGVCRCYINSCVGRIKRMFRWAVGEEIVPRRSIRECPASAACGRDN